MVAAAPCSDVLLSRVSVLRSRLSSGSLSKLNNSMVTFPLMGALAAVDEITGG